MKHLLAVLGLAAAIAGTPAISIAQEKQPETIGQTNQGGVYLMTWFIKYHWNHVRGATAVMTSSSELIPMKTMQGCKAEEQRIQAEAKSWPEVNIGTHCFEQK